MGYSKTMSYKTGFLSTRERCELVDRTGLSWAEISGDVVLDQAPCAIDLLTLFKKKIVMLSQNVLYIHLFMRELLTKVGQQSTDQRIP